MLESYNFDFAGRPRLLPRFGADLVGESPKEGVADAECIAWRKVASISSHYQAHLHGSDPQRPPALVIYVHRQSLMESTVPNARGYPL